MQKYTKTSPKFFENIRNTNGVEEKRCTVCKEWKPATTEYFYMRNKSKPELGLNAPCKECSRKDSLSRRHSDPDKTKNIDKRAYDKRSTTKKWVVYNREKGNRQRESGYQKEYQRNNPDKMKLYASKHRNHDITSKEWESCLKYFNYSCAYCGMTLEEHLNKYKEKLHKEHVDDKGYNDIRNCVPACKRCNDKKWQHPFEEWYREQSFFSEEKRNIIKSWITEDYKKYIGKKLPYKILRKRINNQDDTYSKQYQLWTMDEKRNISECIAICDNKTDLESYINQII